MRHDMTGQEMAFNPLPLDKRVGEFIEFRNKKPSPTPILSTLGCLSLCHSVTLRPINPKLSQQPAMGLDQNKLRT